MCVCVCVYVQTYVYAHIDAVALLQSVYRGHVGRLLYAYVCVCVYAHTHVYAHIDAVVLGRVCIEGMWAGFCIGVCAQTCIHTYT